MGKKILNPKKFILREFNIPFLGFLFLYQLWNNDKKCTRLLSPYQFSQQMCFDTSYVVCEPNFIGRLNKNVNFFLYILTPIANWASEHRDLKALSYYETATDWAWETTY